jgi:hypothetical protein
MKFIGLLLMLVGAISMNHGITISLVFWFLVGLGMVFFDVITHWMKCEITSRTRRRR